MDQIQQLLKPELIVMAAAFVGGFQIVWRVFDAVKILPTIPLWSVPLAMVPTAFGLAIRYAQLNPLPAGAPVTLADDWWIQGSFLLFVMLSGWLGALLAFNGAPGNGTKSNSALGRAMNTVAIIVAALALTLSAPASAEEQPSVLRWDVKRLSVGVSAGGAIHGVEDSRPVGSSFRLDAYGNWNLSTHLNAFVGVDHSFADAELTNWKAGGSGQLTGTDDADNFSLFMGAYYVKRVGEGAEAFQFRESWEVYLQGAQVLARTESGRKWLALVAGARFDPNNNYPTGLLMLRAQPFGGSKR